MKKKWIWIIIILLVNIIIFSYYKTTVRKSDNRIITISSSSYENEKDTVKGYPSTENVKNITENSYSIEYRNFYRGYVTLKTDNHESFPEGIYIVENDDDWHDFMDRFTPGIPYNTYPDFSKECLIYDGHFGSKPIYNTEINIEDVNIKNNKLDIEYSYPTTGVYVQNIEGIEHCFVTIIIVNKSDLPKDLQNEKIYKKN